MIRTHFRFYACKRVTSAPNNIGTSSRCQYVHLMTIFNKLLYKCSVKVATPSTFGQKLSPASKILISCHLNEPPFCILLHTNSMQIERKYTKLIATCVLLFLATKYIKHRGTKYNAIVLMLLLEMYLCVPMQ